MNALVRAAALTVGCTGLTAGWAGGAGRLAIRVSPTVALAPADVTVRAIVEADADNRALEVTAESDDFYRSSQLPLEGAGSPRITEIRLGGLPDGEYVVTVTLIGTRGRRASMTRSIHVGAPRELGPYLARPASRRP
jgi:hypothetical protein